MLGKRLKQSLYCFSVITMAALVGITVAKAGNGGQQLSTLPFITAESPQTQDFHAAAFHKGRRNPYLFATNNSAPPEGSYSGVLLNSNGQPGFNVFDTFSFAYRGTRDARAFVVYKPLIGPFRTKSLAMDQGLDGGTDKDGFRNVKFRADQFGISRGSFIRDIAIVPPPSKDAGRFLIDDIRVDNEPVKKVLATKFFGGENAPIGGEMSFAAAAAPPVSTPTAVVVRNSSNASVEVWVTLGVGGGSSYTQVNQVFPQSGVGDPQWANGGTSSEDHLTLPAASGNTPSIIRSINSLTAVNGRTFFGAAGSSVDPTGGGGCPTTAYPCGANLAEWSLNPSNVVADGEACNISCVNGMNAKVQMVYQYNNGFPWNSGVDSKGKLKIVKVASTKTILSKNNDNDGVYPFNAPCCTTPVCGNANCGYVYPVPPCSSSSQPSTCWPNAPATSASKRKLCQIQRNNGTGGAVHIVFNGFTSQNECR